MKALLTQLALLMGGAVAAASLAINVARMDLLTAVFRATLVFFATVIVLFVFLHFFSVILVRFVAEQVLQNRAPETDDKGEVWLPKCDIARAYGVFVQSVNAGLKSLAKTGDFDEYRDVRVEHFTYNGKNCSVDLYSLATIIALGFRMKGLKCEAFRKWAARRQK